MHRCVGRDVEAFGRRRRQEAKLRSRKYDELEAHDALADQALGLLLCRLLARVIGRGGAGAVAMAIDEEILGQLHRIGKGEAPRPNESGLKAFLLGQFENGINVFKTRRLRAS